MNRKYDNPKTLAAVERARGAELGRPILLKSIHFLSVCLFVMRIFLGNGDSD